MTVVLRRLGKSCVTPATSPRSRTPLLDAFERGTHACRRSARASRTSTWTRAYDVLREIETRRSARGWRPVGRKIGFTNRTIWPRYGVYRPMWAHVWRETVHDAPGGSATLSLAAAPQPRIEPEVVFGLRAGRLRRTPTRVTALAATEWIAPGFEIVQSHFPGLEIHLARLHGGIRPASRARGRSAHARRPARPRDARASALPSFELTLRRGDAGRSTAASARTCSTAPRSRSCISRRCWPSSRRCPPLAAGEIVTTGTITDAWPVARRRNVVERLRRARHSRARR